MGLKTLKRRKEFDRLRSGRKWVAKGFILQGMPQKPETVAGQPRFGFAVGSKALAGAKPGGRGKRAGAVIRNRARRRLKEAVRLVSLQYAQPNYDYVVIGRREALHQPFHDLLEDFKLAFERVNSAPRESDGIPPQKIGKPSTRHTQRQNERLKQRAGQPLAQGDRE